MHEIIEKTSEMIARNPSILKTLMSKKFCITIEIDGAKYTATMNQASKEQFKWEEDRAQKSDITAKLSKATYQAIISDAMSWIDAFIYGDITFDGDPTLFTDLARILELARPLYASNVNIAQRKDAMEDELEAKLNHD